MPPLARFSRLTLLALSVFLLLGSLAFSQAASARPFFADTESLGRLTAEGVSKRAAPFDKLRALSASVIESGTRSGPVAAQAGSVPLIDIVAVVDDSGSMTEGEHPSDPAGLRYAAARLLVDLAQSGDRVDVVSFSDSVRVVGAGACTVKNPADTTTTCPRTVVGEANRAALRAQLQYDGRKGNTRMDLALAMARNLLRSSRDGRAQYVFFLTDGVPYPGDQMPALYRVIDDLAADGVQVFPILLGTQTSEEVTNRIVQRTNGIAYPAASAADLLNIYGAIYASIRPHLYVSVLESDTTGYAEFFTNAAQGITDVTVVLPRQDNAAVYKSLNLNDAALAACQPLPDGTAVSCLQPPDPYYDRFTVTHNQPLNGKWTAQLDGAQKMLVIVQAQTDLTVTAPPPAAAGQRPSLHWSAARRGEALLVVSPLQGGKPVAGLPISLNGAQLDGRAYSLDGTAYWQVVPAPPPDARTPVKIQVGQEVAPILLQQTVYLQTGDFPLLVVDRPLPDNAGLTEKNQVPLKVHFEASSALTEPAVRAVIRDLTDPAHPGVVYEAALKCDAAGACADEGFDRVQFGHRYEAVFVGQARFNGTPYGDFVRAPFSTPNQLVIDGLPAVGLDLSTVISAPLPIKLRAVGVGDFCTPQAKLNLHRADAANTPIAQATVEMKAPAMSGGQSFDTSLGFVGLAQLPPGQYLGEVTFACSAVAVAPAQVPVAYGITPGTVTLLPNGPLDFGALDTAGKTAELKLDLDLSSPDLASHIGVALISVVPDAQSKVVVTTGPVEPAGGTRYKLPLFVTLRDASLPPVHYEGKLQVSARPGDILSPPDGVVTVLFNLPPPVLQTVRLLPNGPVDFGLLESVGQTVIRPLNVELSDPKTPLTVTLESVDPAAMPGVTLATGPLKHLGLGGTRYELPLFMTLQADLPQGQYHGQVRVSVGDNTVLTPADGVLTVQFKRPTLLESVWARFEPIVSLVDWWAWPFTPPVWPAFICWPGLILAALVVYRLGQNAVFNREMRQRGRPARSRPGTRRPATGTGTWQPPDLPAEPPRVQSPKPKAPPPPLAAPPTPPTSTERPAPTRDVPKTEPKAEPKPDETRRRRYRDD